MFFFSDVVLLGKIALFDVFFSLFSLKFNSVLLAVLAGILFKSTFSFIT